MQVGADTDAFAFLPEVHCLVLIAQEGERNLLGGAGQFGQGDGDGVEVLHRRERDRHVYHAADFGRPDAGGSDDEVCVDVTVGGLHGGDAPGDGSEAGHFDAAEELGAGLLGRARHCLRRPGRLGLDVGGDVERAEDSVGEEWEAGACFVGGEQVAFHAPGEAVAVLAFEVGEALGRPGDFHAADLAGARFAIEHHLGPEIDAMACELGHGFGCVDLEDEARRVRSGAAGLEERALIDDDDLVPSEFRQVVGHATAGDSGADYHHLGMLGQHHCPYFPVTAFRPQAIIFSFSYGTTSRSGSSL